MKVPLTAASGNQDTGHHRQISIYLSPHCLISSIKFADHFYLFYKQTAFAKDDQIIGYFYKKNQIEHWIVHVDNVTRLALWLAESASFNFKERENLWFACKLHDIGKGIVDRQINSHLHLSDSELREVDAKHELRGLEVIAEIQPSLRRRIPQDVKKSICYHHDFEGLFKDNRLKQDKKLFLLTKRIAVLLISADIISAMLEKRPYHADTLYSAQDILRELNKKGVYSELKDMLGLNEQEMLAIAEKSIKKFYAINNNTQLKDENKNNLAQQIPSKLRKAHKLDFTDVILSPLKILSFVINRIFDLYCFIFPGRSIIYAIKQRFGNEKIKILDVGTANGLFVERFQNLLNKKDIEAEVIGIDNNPSRIAQGLHAGRNVRVLDISDSEDDFLSRSFDLIIINAPERPADFLIEESMKILKPDGLLILRLHNGMHYEVNFGPEYQQHLVDKLRKDYKVKILKRDFIDLPTGQWYQLQAPILVSHKNPASLMEQAKDQKSTEGEVRNESLQVRLESMVDGFLSGLTSEEKLAQVKLINNVNLNAGDEFHIKSVDRKLDAYIGHLSRFEQSAFTGLMGEKLVLMFGVSLKDDLYFPKNTYAFSLKIDQSI